MDAYRQALDRRIVSCIDSSASFSGLLLYKTALHSEISKDCEYLRTNSLQTKSVLYRFQCLIGRFVKRVPFTVTFKRDCDIENGGVIKDFAYGLKSQRKRDDHKHLDAAVIYIYMEHIYTG